MPFPSRLCCRMRFLLCFLLLTLPLGFFCVCPLLVVQSVILKGEELCKQCLSNAPSIRGKLRYLRDLPDIVWQRTLAPVVHQYQQVRSVLDG
jgi:predicted nucleic acid-binding Zn finger protein